MKSRIAKVIIVPTKLLEDRRIKIKVKGLGWVPLEDRENEITTCLIITSIEAAINPDDIFCNWCEYYEKGQYWGAEVKVSRSSKRTVLLCYRENHKGEWQWRI